MTYAATLKSPAILQFLFNALLGALAIMTPVSAQPAPRGPTLRIDASVIARAAGGTKETLAKPTVIVESGKQASIKFGKVECLLTPTLNDNGTVHIETEIIEHNPKKAITIAKPKVVIELDKEGELRIKQTKILLRPTLLN